MNMHEILVNVAVALVAGGAGFIAGAVKGGAVEKAAIAEFIRTKESMQVDAERCLTWIKSHLGMK